MTPCHNIYARCLCAYQRMENIQYAKWQSKFKSIVQHSILFNRIITTFRALSALTIIMLHCFQCSVFVSNNRFLYHGAEFVMFILSLSAEIPIRFLLYISFLYFRQFFFWIHTRIFEFIPAFISVLLYSLCWLIHVKERIANVCASLLPWMYVCTMYV